MQPVGLADPWSTARAGLFLKGLRLPAKSGPPPKLRFPGVVALKAGAWTGSTSIAWGLLGVHHSGVRLQNPELGVGPSKLCFRKPPRHSSPLCKEFIGVTLVSRIMQVSGVQSILHHLHTVLCDHRHKSSLRPSPLSPTQNPPPSSLAITTLLSLSMRFSLFFLLCSIPLTPALPHHPRQQLSACSLSMRLSLFCLLAQSVH